MDAQAIIAKRIALELRDGMLVNLGIGIPTQVANYVPPGIHIFFQSENGLIGTGPVPPGSRTRGAAVTKPPANIAARPAAPLESIFFMIFSLAGAAGEGSRTGPKLFGPPLNIMCKIHARDGDAFAFNLLYLLTEAAACEYVKRADTAPGWVALLQCGRRSCLRAPGCCR